MEIGIKFGNQDQSFDYLADFVDKTDFVELYVRPGRDHSGLKNFNLPVVIHCAHSEENVNFTDSGKRDINLHAIQHAIKDADFFGSEKIIFHPEKLENDKCSRQSLVNFIRDNYDPRLLIENMPFSPPGATFLGSDFEELKALIKELKVGFCLDFAHAAEYALSVGLDYEDYIKNLLSLKPGHFHISDTKLILQPTGFCVDNHLNVGDGDINYEFVKSILPENASVTLETPKNKQKQLREIKYLRNEV